MLLLAGMKNTKLMKNYLIPSFCLLISTCLGDKTVNIQAGTTYTNINDALTGLTNNEKLKLTITSDPNMEKTWYTLNSFDNIGIELELTAIDGALSDATIESLAECLLLASKNITLTKLNISNNNLSSGYNFLQSMAYWAELTELNISGNKGSFCTTLLDKLTTTQLTKIEASNCELKAKNFEKILNLNSKITTLNLSNNKMDGLTNNFAKGLLQNSITTLNLSNNKGLLASPCSAFQLLKGINGKRITITLVDTNATDFIKAWLNGAKSTNTLTF